VQFLRACCALRLLRAIRTCRAFRLFCAFRAFRVFRAFHAFRLRVSCTLCLSCVSFVSCADPRATILSDSAETSKSMVDLLCNKIWTVGLRCCVWDFKNHASVLVFINSNLGWGVWEFGSDILMFQNCDFRCEVSDLKVEVPDLKVPDLRSRWLPQCPNKCTDWVQCLELLNCMQDKFKVNQISSQWLQPQMAHGYSAPTPKLAAARARTENRSLPVWRGGNSRKVRKVEK